MTLTYIFHSGFALETEQSILVFDYWMDPSDVMDGVLRSEKPLYVFSSHFHEDHFTKEIFEWKKQRKDITYILSKDIYKHRRASKEDADVWLAKGGTWSDDSISVWALGSTDSGVSWIVETVVAVSSSNGSKSDCSFPCTSLQALNRASSDSRAELVRTMPSRERGRAELNPLGV